MKIYPNIFSKQVITGNFSEYDVKLSHRIWGCNAFTTYFKSMPDLILFENIQYYTICNYIHVTKK